MLLCICKESHSQQEQDEGDRFGLGWDLKLRLLVCVSLCYFLHGKQSSGMCKAVLLLWTNNETLPSILQALDEWLDTKIEVYSLLFLLIILVLRKDTATST